MITVNSHEKPIQPVPRDGVVPLSFAQQRLWFLAEFEPDSIEYVTPTVLRLRGPLDVKMLNSAFSMLLARHEPLRTTFEPSGQVIHPPTEVEIPVVDAPGGETPPPSGDRREPGPTDTPVLTTMEPDLADEASPSPGDPRGPGCVDADTPVLATTEADLAGRASSSPDDRREPGRTDTPVPTTMEADLAGGAAPSPGDRREPGPADTPVLTTMEADLAGGAAPSSGDRREPGPTDIDTPVVTTTVNPSSATRPADPAKPTPSPP
ncbi:hypothetical protein GCM10029964_066020 [Kibdelosporangium lantanae]